MKVRYKEIFYKLVKILSLGERLENLPCSTMCLLVLVLSGCNCQELQFQNISFLFSLLCFFVN